jgi:small subunit ribosomal protein S9
MAEERDDLPQEPESGAPEEEARESEAIGPEIGGMEELAAQGRADEAAAKEAAAEEPTAEEPAGEEPTAEEPAGEEPTAEEPAGEEPAGEEPASEEPASEEPAAEEPASEEPASEEPAAEEPVSEEPASKEPAAEEAGAGEPAAEEPAAEAAEPAAEGAEPTAEGEQPPEGEAGAEDRPARERRPRRDRRDDKPEEEVIPGMHLEPDLVLEETAREESEFGQYAEADEEYEPGEAGVEAAAEVPGEPEPVVHTPLDLAADARYNATGKRKSAIARVILKPGEGTYSVNGRHLDEYFPRVRLQRMARQPLEAAGYQTRMDVVARIHGGGVSAQATALRHGITRALVEADPALRGELKRRGYLTRDPRVKERKKAGLKKARKRPQFSKR